MRAWRVLVCLTVFAAAMAAGGRAQQPEHPWLVSAEGGPLVAQARGTLATYLAGGYGFGARFHAARAERSLGFRVDGEYLTFGEHTTVRPYNGAGPPVGITTGSRVFMATAGPEWRRDWRRLGAALTLGGGMAYFSNTGAVDGLGDPDRFSRANSYGQITWAVRGGAAANLRLGRAPRSARLELGAQLVQSGPTPYLREYNLPYGVISGIYLYPTPISPSFVVLSLGISAGV